MIKVSFSYANLLVSYVGPNDEHVGKKIIEGAIIHKCMDSHNKGARTIDRNILPYNNQVLQNLKNLS